MPIPRAQRAETAAPTRAMPGAGKPEARAEGIRVGVRWSNAYSLSSRFGLHGKDSSGQDIHANSPGKTVGRPTPHPGHDGRRTTPHPGHDGRETDAAPRARRSGGRRRTPGTTVGGRRRTPGTTVGRPTPHPGHDGRRPTPHPGHDGRRPTPHPGHDGREADAAPRARRSGDRRRTPGTTVDDAAPRALGHNGRRTTPQRGPCRVPGSPRREPREYGSVSGEASRIPSARASGFTAKAAAHRTSMPIPRTRRSGGRRDAVFLRLNRGFLPL
jgi:hypothetical protein